LLLLLLLHFLFVSFFFYLRFGYPSDVSLAVQEKAWMDESKMTVWFDQVWEQREQKITKSPSILIMDSFEGTSFKSSFFPKLIDDVVDDFIS
jgi:hypothetical protein